MLRTISHEIRNPLMALLGLSQALLGKHAVSAESTFRTVAQQLLLYLDIVYSWHCSCMSPSPCTCVLVSCLLPRHD